MSYREIPERRILKFPATAGFKGWKDYFTDESVAHPAKMNLNLLRWILETSTKPGKIILDPMAGTGSTIVLASLLGRHGIAVEYEPRFCEMIRGNIKRTERQSTLTPKGRMTCIQGDARELSKLLGESDAIITSPPYERTEAMHDKNWFIKHREEFGGGGVTGEYAPSEGNIGRLSHGDINSIVTSPPYASPGGAIHDRAFMEKLALDPTSNRYGRKTFPGYGKYSENPEQIGNKPYGDIEAIITSPPYGSDNANLRERKDKSAQSILATTGVRAVPLEENNIGVLEYGEVDAVITSPPYEGSNVSGGDEEGRKKRLIESGHDIKEFFGGKARGATLRPYDEVDAVITSPPYADSVKRGDEGPTASGKDSPTYNERLEQPKIYSNDPENIGNLKSESYLEAMLQVYRECWKVLKQSGKLILVTKNFIRDKQVVRLDSDTIKLCEASGFTLKDRWYFKLPTKSFWRIIYSQKYPDVPEVEYEDVLIFEKHRFVTHITPSQNPY